MKQTLITALCGLLVLSSCGTNAGEGAFVGGQFGHVIGSAIGGISGGWRGEHVGSLIGTVGGVVAGAAIGAAVDNAQQRQYENTMQRRNGINQRTSSSDESGFDAQGRGDDRIDFGDSSSDYGSYSLAQPTNVEPTAENVARFDGYTLHVNPAIQIRNAMVVDYNEDKVLTRNEECRISFEIMNNSDKPIYNVQPTVVEVTGNKHVHISPNLNVECIPPKQGVRYTATILADGRLKDGEVCIRIAVAQNNKEITSQIQELVIPTRKTRVR